MMKSPYRKNFTENGYLMHYRKGLNIAPFNKRVLQFKIELPEILPLIWRRILVPSDYNFWDLHVAIQDSMGWSDYHLHHFVFKGRGKSADVKIGIPNFEQEYEGEIDEVYPSWEISIINYFSDLGKSAKYLYDYGDSWWHTVQLEGYLFKDKTIRYPVCIDGERACPPEDCGGEPGYYEMLKTLSDPANEDYQDMKTWVGETWNSEKFDKTSIQFYEPNKRWKKAFLEKQ